MSKITPEQVATASRALERINKLDSSIRAVLVVATRENDTFGRAVRLALRDASTGPLDGINDAEMTKVVGLAIARHIKGVRDKIADDIKHLVEIEAYPDI